MKSTVWMLAALIAASSLTRANAQAAESGQPSAGGTPAPASDQVAPSPAAVCCRIAAGTVVELEISEAISSARHKRGDKFGLRLHAPVVLDGTTVIPAGAIGTGEVVHSAGSRGGGKPGELLLAARFLEQGAIQLPLRGLKLGATGTDASKVALAVSMAIGPFAQFIHGGEIEIPAGTVANAKLAQDFIPAADLAPAPTPPPSNQE